MESETNCVGVFPFSSCDNIQWIVVVLLGMYLMGANLMLVALLVRMDNVLENGELEHLVTWLCVCVLLSLLLIDFSSLSFLFLFSKKIFFF